MKKYRIISFSFSLFFEKNYIIKYNTYYNNIDFRGIIKKIISSLYYARYLENK